MDSYYYYILFFASFLVVFSLVPLVFEIEQEKLTSNIPYTTLSLLLLAFLSYLFVSLAKGYIAHSLLYLVGVITVAILLFQKKKFNKNNVTLLEKK